MPSVLLVDRDDAYRDHLSRTLRDRGFTVTAAADATSGLAAARRQAPDFAVVDLRGPDPRGFDLLDALIPTSPDTKIVVMNRHGSIASAVAAMQRGAHYYLSKPVDTAELVEMLCPGEDAPVASQGEARSTPSLARAVWEHMQRVLEDCDGNISAAARRLRIARRTLQLKLKKYPPRN